MLVNGPGQFSLWPFTFLFFLKFKLTVQNSTVIYRIFGGLDRFSTVLGRFSGIIIWVDYGSIVNISKPARNRFQLNKNGYVQGYK